MVLYNLVYLLLHLFQHTGSSPPKKKKTKEDFYAFCTMILEYTQYESNKHDVSSESDKKCLTI